MTKTLLSRFFFRFSLTATTGVCATAVILSLATPFVSTLAYAAQPTISLKAKTVSGSATNTITNLVYNDNGTISIEAEQEGNLSHIGHFTGHFSYLAIPSPVSIVLLGTAELTDDNGDQLFLTAVITEFGTDYPYTVVGLLTATGGTGRFAGTTGVIEVSGKDTAALTDTLKFKGSLVLAQ